MKKLIIVLCFLMGILLAFTGCELNDLFGSLETESENPVPIGREMPGAEYEDPEKYAGKYGYGYLGELDNGQAMRQLYSEFELAAEKYHACSSDIPDGDRTVGKFDYISLGLTLEQAISVWVTFKADHPLYYWISNETSYTDSEIYLISYEEYCFAEVREDCNDYVYGMVCEYAETLSGYSSVYDISLGLYEKVISDNRYAYSSDGKTPENSNYAHSVLGFAKYGKGVCESYAKTYQLILNFFGIENILVSGQLDGVPHMWNLIQADDDQWYWCDLTLGDTPDWRHGVSYNYFCVTDSQLVEWRDGSYAVGDKTFLSGHQYDAPGAYGLDFAYALPERAADLFTSDRICVMREGFVCGGLLFARISAGSVQLIGVETSDAKVIIPDSIRYMGNDFKVVSVGMLKDRILSSTGHIKVHNTLKSLTLPATVDMIWDNALNIESLKEINVNEDNSVYSSSGGVLYTKSGYTLIQYPAASEREEFIIPECVRYIAYGAFGCKNNLKRLTVGSSVSGVGIINFGYNYPDSEAEALGSFGVENAVDQARELESIKANMKRSDGFERIE